MREIRQDQCRPVIQLVAAFAVILAFSSASRAQLDEVVPNFPMPAPVSQPELPAGDDGLPFEGGRWVRVSTSCGDKRVSDEEIARFEHVEDPRLSIRAWAEFFDRDFRVALLSEPECDGREGPTSDGQTVRCGEGHLPEDINVGRYSYSASSSKVRLRASSGFHYWGRRIGEVEFDFVGSVLILRSDDGPCFGLPWFSYWIRFPGA